MTSPDGDSARPLSRAACLALLAPGGLGRVAATMRAVPVIIPVSFVLVDGRVVFSPGALEGAERALSGSVVAFETDHRSDDGRSAWDVHVTGVASHLADDTRPMEFRLSSELVSGRRSGP